MATSRVEFESSSSLVLQQTISGGGTFTGVEVGRAVIALGVGASKVTVKARNLGTYANGYAVVLLDAGFPVTTTQAKWDPNNNVLTVFLRRTATVQATAQEVADVVNAVALSPVLAEAGGTGVVVPAASTPLAGGLDPTVFRNTRYSFVPAGGVSGGLFQVDQPGSLLVRQFEAVLGASVLWTLSTVNLNEGLQVIAGESVVVATATGATIALLGLNLILAPLQALQLVTATTGVARAFVHRELNFPVG